MTEPENSRTVQAVNALIVVGFILAGLWLFVMIAPPPHAFKDDRSLSMTQSQHQALQVALREYREDYGSFPPPRADFGSQPLVRMLDGDISNGGPAKRYLEFPPERIRDGQLTDSTGKPLRYKLKGTQQYQIWGGRR